MDLAAGTKERAVARRCLVATEPGDARPGSNCAVGVSEGQDIITECQAIIDGPFMQSNGES